VSRTRGGGDTCPAGLAGGLDVDLDQHVLRGAGLSAVVGGDRQLVRVLLAIVQFLSVLNVAWEEEEQSEHKDTSQSAAHSWTGARPEH